MEVRSTGDGFGGPAPLGPAGEDTSALLRELLAEQRRTNELLHRIVLGDVDTLDADDVMQALKIGRTKLGEMIDDGELPMQTVGRRRVIARDAFRAVLRSWMDRASGAVHSGAPQRRRRA